MKQRIFNFIMALFIGVVPISIYAQSTITLEDIWLKGTFNARGVPGFMPLANGNDYLRRVAAGPKTQALVSYSYKTGNAQDTIFTTNFPALGTATADEFRFDAYTLSDDEGLILFQSETEAIYRHSARARVNIWDRAAKTMRRMGDEKVMYPGFSPDGKWVAYVNGNNLYRYELATGRSEAITNDGKPNNIINGAVDWVYEEEFSMSVGYQWSPDSRYIAFYRFDESAVPEFSMEVYDGGLYPGQERFKYPKAGETNSMVSIWIFDLTTGKKLKVNLPESPDVYYPRIKWTGEKDILSIQKLNRHQNHLELLLVDAKSGNAQKIWEEKSEWYVDISDDLHWLEGGKSFIITSERSGSSQIFHFDKKGKQLAEVSRGSAEVVRVLGVDEKNKWVYYQAFANGAPVSKVVRRSQLSGKKTEEITPGNSGTASVSFNKNFSYGMLTRSAKGTPPVYSIVDGRGTEIRKLETNENLVKKLDAANLGKFNFLKIPGATEELNAWIIYPPDMDFTKKYPVLMYVYGGPGSQTVMDAWGGPNYLWYQMLAQKGYIIVSVDNTGTGGRGAAFKKKTYLELGLKESDDQIAAAKWLGKQAWADASRIGIWGWSYGGFMAALSLGRGEGVFKTAISVAPVTDWRLYDNIYTERYMRTPAENADGYEKTKPANYLDASSGKLLLIHGMADDNVHLQNAVELVKELIEKDAPFDSEFYPNKNHGIGGAKTRFQLFKRMTNFLIENL